MKMVSISKRVAALAGVEVAAAPKKKAKDAYRPDEEYSKFILPLAKKMQIAVQKVWIDDDSGNVAALIVKMNPKSRQNLLNMEVDKLARFGSLCRKKFPELHGPSLNTMEDDEWYGLWFKVPADVWE